MSDPLPFGKHRLDPTLEAYFASRKMGDAAAYLARGRSHRDVADEQLSDMYLIAFSAWLDDVLATPKRNHLDDIDAEIRLRGNEPPMLPFQEIRRLQSLVRELAKVPEFLDTTEENIRQFLETIANPKRKS